MTSHAFARPLAALAVIAVISAGASACNSGGTSAQYSTDGPGQGYSGGNQASSLYWQNQAAQNAYSATSDMGSGGVANPADESNSVSYSGN